MFPHQLWIVFSPNFPFRGYCRLKETRNPSARSGGIENISLTRRRQQESRSPFRSQVQPRAHLQERESGPGLILIEGRDRRPTLTVVFCPPTEISFPDHIIECEADERPRDIVYCGCWRYRTCARQHHRNARTICRIPSKKMMINHSLDIFEKTARPPLVDQPDCERCQSANQEEVCKAYKYQNCQHEPRPPLYN